MKKVWMSLAAALVALPLALKSSAPQHTVSSFTINTALIFELYNVAQQNNGTVTTWPAGMNSAVVQAVVRNDGPEGQLCFQVVVREPGSACSGQNVVWSPTLRTREAVKSGETRTLTAADFDLDSGSGGGSFCTEFEEQIKRDFERFDPGQIQKAVDMFLKRRFEVCLLPVVCGWDGSYVSGNQGACSVFTLFQGNPGMQAQAALPIHPHNGPVPDCNVNFLWTSAMHSKLGAGQVAYTLELREGLEGEPLARVEVPAGQTHYQWSARDRALEPGKRYHWRVISRNARNGQPFGGPDGRGWNAQKWFSCGGDQSLDKCRYSLEDLDRFVQANADPKVREALRDLRIQAVASGKLDDPEVCRLLSGKARLSSVQVTRK